MADTYMTARQAWDALKKYKVDYYDGFSAMYSGDHADLSKTAAVHTFWKRSRCNCRVHVPIAADIAQTSANLLFSQPPKMTVFHDGTENNETAQQKRLDTLIAKNNFLEKLNEGAETASALGDVYYKIRWDAKALDYPIIDIAQPDMTMPEYRLGRLVCVHFFTPIVTDAEKNKVIRVYERYERGRITMQMFEGDFAELGKEASEGQLAEFGFLPEVKTPVDELLAVHIANIRPNRKYRTSMRGRSDLDGLRDLCDSLDETYSSWVRDIRLAKAKTIVPVAYMKRQPSAMLEGLKSAASWEFDPDVETYVAMDIDPDTASNGGINTIQPAIRATEHANTCAQIVRDILSIAGYSPQTFGLDINGTAQSGTALNIREKKSVITRDKKQTYWQNALESIMTALIHVDAALYPNAGSHTEDNVKVGFSDTMGVDINTIASSVQMLNNAQAVSLEQKVAMQHPDWSEAQQAEEVDRIRKQYALNSDSPMPDIPMGDGENGGVYEEEQE